MKTLREKEKMLVTSIFSFSHNVFDPIKHKEVIILANFILLSANASNLDQSGVLSFGKELTFYQMTNFRLFHTDRVCRRQFRVQ